MRVGARPAIEFLKSRLRRRLLVKRGFGAEHSRGQQRTVGAERIVSDSTVEGGCPARGLARSDINRVHARLQVGVRAFHRALLDDEEDALAVRRPLHIAFERLVLRELPRGILRAGLAGLGNVDLDLLQSLEALRDAVGRVGHLTAVGRDRHALHTVRRRNYSLSAWGFAGFLILLFLLVLLALFGLVRAKLNLPLQGFGDVDTRDDVTPLLLAIADHVLPLFLAFFFLGRGQGKTGGEIERLGIGAPGKFVHIFGASRHGKGLASVDGNEVEVDGTLLVSLVLVIRVGVIAVTVGEEGDPLAVRRPLGVGVMARLGKGNDEAVAVAPEPEILTKALGIPVGAVGGDDQHVSVWRQRHTAKIDGVEELFEGEAWLGAVWRRSEKRRGRGHDDKAHRQRTDGCRGALHAQGEAKGKRLSGSHDHPEGRFDGELIINTSDSDQRATPPGPAHRPYRHKSWCCESLRTGDDEDYKGIDCPQTQVGGIAMFAAFPIALFIIGALVLVALPFGISLQSYFRNRGRRTVV